MPRSIVERELALTVPQIRSYVEQWEAIHGFHSTSAGPSHAEFRQNWGVFTARRCYRISWQESAHGKLRVSLEAWVKPTVFLIPMGELSADPNTVFGMIPRRTAAKVLASMVAELEYADSAADGARAVDPAVGSQGSWLGGHGEPLNKSALLGFWVALTVAMALSQVFSHALFLMSDAEYDPEVLLSLFWISSGPVATVFGVALAAKITRGPRFVLLASLFGLLLIIPISMISEPLFDNPYEFSWCQIARSYIQDLMFLSLLLWATRLRPYAWWRFAVAYAITQIVYLWVVLPVAFSLQEGRYVDLFNWSNAGISAGDLVISVVFGLILVSFSRQRTMAFTGGAVVEGGRAPRRAPAGAAVGEIATPQEVIQLLRTGSPAKFTCIADASRLDLLTRFFEACAGAASAPRLTFYVLRAVDERSMKFPVLILRAGELSQHHARFDMGAIRERVLPNQGWSALWGDGVEDRANFPMPGCVLETTAYFDEIADAVKRGRYEIVRTIRGPRAG